MPKKAIPFEKSFASHPRAVQWSSWNELKPHMVKKQSNVKFSFDCDECGHSFDATLNSITSNNRWCGFCSGRNVCGDERCSDCHKRSFAIHEKSEFWSIRNPDQPRDLGISSNKRRLFDCECGHSFEAVLNDISKGMWCGFCSGRKLCGHEGCNNCYKRSFASNEKSKFWSEKNTLKPIQCAIKSKKKYIFECDECLHEFKSSTACVSKGTWCPHCKNKTEAILFDFLKSIYPNTVRQFKANWCKNKTYLPFDFCIPELRIIIELDGGQHFCQVSNWKSPNLSAREPSSASPPPRCLRQR